jgi:hemolysin III
MSLKNVDLHKYSLAEELISSISHGIGALLAVAALAVAVIFSVFSGGKKVFRIIDHCSVFLLIAGSYTPYTLVTLRGPLGWTLFGVVWAAAIFGIVLTAVDFKRFAKFSMACYLLMGWVVVAAYKPLAERLAPNGLLLLVLGGILYTVGAVLYLIGRKKKYIHSVWHFFVLAGSILHYFSILFYVVLA